jgi:hypothetical protein
MYIMEIVLLGKYRIKVFKMDGQTSEPWASKLQKRSKARKLIFGINGDLSLY